MKIDKRLLTGIVFVILTMVTIAMAWAGECDFCVCKGKDTANACTKCCSSAQPGDAAITELKLRISDDGKAIVDQNGKVVARFAEGTRVQIKAKAEKSASQKMQGCFKCRQECIIWEGTKCVKTIRTCDWDFDCK